MITHDCYLLSVNDETGNSKKRIKSAVKTSSVFRYYVAVAQRPNRLKILKSPLKV